MISSITIVGMGNVGRALSHTGNTLVAHNGWEEWLELRAKHPNRASSSIVLNEHSDEYELIILAVHEAQLSSMVRQMLSAFVGDTAQKVVVFTNGATGPEPLLSLRSHVCAVGSMHPFQTFGAGVLPTIYEIGWGVECDDVAWPVICEYVTGLRGVPARFTTRSREERLIYHAAAVAASNLTYASIDLARHLARTAGIPVADFIIPIVRQTVENAANYLKRDEGLDSFPVTGPLARGEVGLVADQIDALPLSERRTYILLSMALLERLRGTLDAEVARQLDEVLTQALHSEK